MIFYTRIHEIKTSSSFGYLCWIHRVGKLQKLLWWASQHRPVTCLWLGAIRRSVRRRYTDQSHLRVGLQRTSDYGRGSRDELNTVFNERARTEAVYALNPYSPTLLHWVLTAMMIEAGQRSRKAANCRTINRFEGGGIKGFSLVNIHLYEQRDFDLHLMACFSDTNRWCGHVNRNPFRRQYRTFFYVCLIFRFIM